MEAKFYEYELYKASDILTSELFKPKPRGTMMATDIESDERVVNASVLLN